MSVIRQDDDTGRIAVNGTMGRLLERARWWAQVALIPLAFLLGAWVVNTEIFHTKVALFMEEGSRFVGTKEINTVQSLRNQISIDRSRELHAHAESGAHPGIDVRVENLEARDEKFDAKLDKLDNKLDEILREIQR